MTGKSFLLLGHTNYCSFLPVLFLFTFSAVPLSLLEANRVLHMTSNQPSVTMEKNQTCFGSWCTIRFQKDVSHEEAAAVDQTESVGDSSAMLSDCPTIPSKVLHVHGYGEKLKSICIYGVLITLLINFLYCLCQ
jgi:hypothetical protein